MSVKLIILIVVSILALDAISGYFIFSSFEDWSKRGQFGDMFGFINSLFSGLAFAGVIIAIILQREELKLQRQELELTRNELARTAHAQELSEAALKKQATASELTAELNALSILISHYQGRSTDLRNNAFRTPQQSEMLSNYEKRLATLTDQLEAIYKSML